MEVRYEDDFYNYILCFDKSELDKIPESDSYEKKEIRGYNSDDFCFVLRKKKDTYKAQKVILNKEKKKPNCCFKESNAKDVFSFENSFCSNRNAVVKKFIEKYKSTFNHDEMNFLILCLTITIFDKFIHVRQCKNVNELELMACFVIASKFIYFDIRKQLFNKYSETEKDVIFHFETFILDNLKVDFEYTSIMSFFRLNNFYDKELASNLETCLSIVLSQSEFNFFSLKTQADACLVFLKLKDQKDVSILSSKCLSLINNINNNVVSSFKIVSKKSKVKYETNLKNMESVLVFDFDSKKKEIGNGAFSNVFRLANHDVAVKVIENNSGVCPSAIREIAFLNRMNHENIISIKNIQVNDINTCFYMPLYKRCLRDFYLSKKFSVSDLKKYFKQILSGVEYLHSLDIIHTDLKPSNMLVSNDDVIKIIDFGSSIDNPFDSIERYNELTTKWYRAPELCLECTRFDNKIDIWSVGCVFYEMIEKIPLFEKKSNIHILFEIFQKYGSPSLEYIKNNFFDVDWCSSNTDVWFPRFSKNKIVLNSKFENETDKNLFINLLERMLEVEPKLRISASEALKHPFFD